MTSLSLPRAPATSAGLVTSRVMFPTTRLCCFIQLPQFKKLVQTVLLAPNTSPLCQRCEYNRIELTTKPNKNSSKFKLIQRTTRVCIIRYDGYRQHSRRMLTPLSWGSHVQIQASSNKFCFGKNPLSHRWLQLILSLRKSRP